MDRQAQGRPAGRRRRALRCRRGASRVPPLDPGRRDPRSRRDRSTGARPEVAAPRRACSRSSSAAGFVTPACSPACLALISATASSAVYGMTSTMRATTGGLSPLGSGHWRPKVPSAMWRKKRPSCAGTWPRRSGTGWSCTARRRGCSSRNSTKAWARTSSWRTAPAPTRPATFQVSTRTPVGSANRH